MMRNRILQITRNMIPYVKELNSVSGNILSSILMQQLDYWFERHPDGFWKFLEASPNHERYKLGDSWLEETGMSVAEFRTAFDKIGHRYKSKSEFDKSEDKFHGRYYASYVDKRSNLTHYVRNHALVDQKLDELIWRNSPKPTGSGNSNTPQVIDNKADVDTTSTVNRQSASTVNAQTLSTVNSQPASVEMQHEQVSKSAFHSSGHVEIAGQEIAVPKLPTTEPTKEITLQQPQTSGLDSTAVEQSDSESSSRILSKLVYPKGLSNREQHELSIMIDLCPEALQQDLLDELEANRSANTLRKGVLPFANALVKRAIAGTFNASAGLAVAAEREKRARNDQVLQTQLSLVPDMATDLTGIKSITDMMANLPKNMRPRPSSAPRENK